MAKARDEASKAKSNKGQSVLTWTMTGMLILGLGGFGVTSFQNTLSSIGSVGETDIRAQDYARAVQQQAAELSRQFGQQITVQQALAFGIDRQALSDLVTRAALDDAARKAGLSVGDQTVAGMITADGTFAGSSGNFDPSLYRELLSRSGLKDTEYENGLRRDAARSLLTGAVTGGFVAPEAATQALYAYIAERRGYSMLRLTEADLASPMAAPTEAELQAWYEANIADFTRPEAKQIRYAWLSPDDLAKEQPVDEAELKRLYDARIAEFVVPPRRLVERLVYPDEAALETAEAALAAGTSFEELVAARGLPMDAVDMGDISEPELGDAGAAVFAAAQGEVVAGDSALGPALFRVNGILPGEETSFEDAREELAAEQQFEAARAVINSRIDEIDDLLAGGASLQELADQTGMVSGTIDYIPGGQGEKLAGYAAFRQAAEALKQGDFAEAIALDDGGVIALEFVATLPPAPIPFEEAKPAVTNALQSAALKTALVAEAERLQAEIKAGADLSARFESVPEIAREGSIPNAPASLMATIFSMEAGELRLISEPGFTALLRLDTIAKAPETGAEAEALKTSIAAQFEQGFAQDVYLGFADSVSSEAGVTLDQNAITLVNSSLR
ncbi:peptidylprolyl isomerase [Pseudogemmobacter faecipullorum]|uniref:SurA N-terminal domain-containing protein n=1 Tax=Pseudogemmobacter faecipullorum TaxID=2755041 RepID=A0ABS8CQQ5_9RHOB|nr:peptidylprolyl isomerase [Pseudogemmobacter faecipullorum]MCB5411525.1 SurA N-terminal domain-containing protein [Pseudogemmobacter faecipullorum]